MKIFSSFLTLILTLLFTSVVNAQNQDDVVYLSNGSVIRGIIIDSTEINLRILNKAGDIWSFSRVEIDSVKREKAYVHKAFVFNQEGSEVSAGLSLMVRSGSNAIDKVAIPGLNMAYSYRFNTFLSTGAEMGIEFYEWMIAPLSAFVKLRSSQNIVSPFLYIRTGYSLPAEKQDDDWEYSYTASGGLHASCGIGIERIINENTSFTLLFSYNYQELHYHLEPLQNWILERDRTLKYNRLRISLGYVFK